MGEYMDKKIRFIPIFVILLVFVLLSSIYSVDIDEDKLFNVTRTKIRQTYNWYSSLNNNAVKRFLNETDFKEKIKIRIGNDDSFSLNFIVEQELSNHKLEYIYDLEYLDVREDIVENLKFTLSNNYEEKILRKFSNNILIHYLYSNRSEEITLKKLARDDKLMAELTNYLKKNIYEKQGFLSDIILGKTLTGKEKVVFLKNYHPNLYTKIFDTRRHLYKHKKKCHRKPFYKRDENQVLMKRAVTSDENINKYLSYLKKQYNRNKIDIVAKNLERKLRYFDLQIINFMTNNVNMNNFTHYNKTLRPNVLKWMLKSYSITDKNLKNLFLNNDFTYSKKVREKIKNILKRYFDFIKGQYESM